MQGAWCWHAATKQQYRPHRRAILCDSKPRPVYELHSDTSKNEDLLTSDVDVDVDVGVGVLTTSPFPQQLALRLGRQYLHTPVSARSSLTARKSPSQTVYTHSYDIFIVYHTYLSAFCIYKLTMVSQLLFPVTQLNHMPPHPMAAALGRRPLFPSRSASDDYSFFFHLTCSTTSCPSHCAVR
jgi:hypothetical protein